MTLLIIMFQNKHILNLYRLQFFLDLRLLMKIISSMQINLSKLLLTYLDRFILQTLKIIFKADKKRGTCDLTWEVIQNHLMSNAVNNLLF